VPCGPVLHVDEVFADPQVRELHLTRTVAHPDGHPIDVLRYPVTFSDTPATIRSGVAREGAHTREVLTELGYTDDDIVALRDAGVITTNEGDRT
jgi:crotonobetainyl-CoA:carnitine CoA-transferase CaiB-like acyl-CoA transferase